MKQTLLGLLISTLLISGCSKQQQVEQKQENVEQKQQEPKTDKPVELNTTPQGEYKSLGMNPQEFQVKFNNFMKFLDEKNVILSINEHPRRSDALYGDAVFITGVSNVAHLAATTNDDNTLNSILMVVRRPSSNSEEKIILTTIYIASETLDGPKDRKDMENRSKTIKSLLLYAINNPNKPIKKEVDGLYIYNVSYLKDANSIIFNIYKK